jgi:hypothetical protein
MSVTAGVAAQDRTAGASPVIEGWAGISAVAAAPSGSLVSSYSPPLLLDGDFSSHGGQVLLFNGQRTIGFNGGVNLLIGSRFGIQVLADWASMKVGGANQPYEYSLMYNSLQPPNGVSTPVKISQTVDWPDSSGTLRMLIFAFNPMVRFGKTDRISVTLSAGPAFQRITGSIQPVAYTQFHLGGHSVLFQDDYQLALAVGPTHQWGFDAGGDVSLPLGHGAAVIIGYRYFGGPGAEVNLAIGSVVNANEIVFSQPLADIAARLEPTPAHVHISSSRVILAVKLMR